MQVAKPANPFTLPDLPYAADALAPAISAETISFHYDRHHRGYINKLNELVAGTEHADVALEQVVRQSEGAVYRNAAQAWNHAFYWQSLAPEGGGEPSGKLAQLIASRWGSFGKFAQLFDAAAIGQFGSGWAWLVQRDDGSLDIRTTSNADSPITDPSLRPLLTCDVWEHAYYIDYRNARDRYLEAWWTRVNWQFAEENLA